MHQTGREPEKRSGSGYRHGLIPRSLGEVAQARCGPHPLAPSPSNHAPREGLGVKLANTDIRTEIGIRGGPDRPCAQALPAAPLAGIAAVRAPGATHGRALDQPALPDVDGLEAAQLDRCAAGAPSAVPFGHAILLVARTHHQTALVKQEML